MRRTLLGALVALTLLAPAATAAGQASVESPLETTEMSLEATGGQLRLSGGTTPVSPGNPVGTVHVWTYTEPCLQRDQSTCLPSNAERQERSIDMAGLTISPRKDASTYEVLIALDDRTGLEAQADEATLEVRPENTTYTIRQQAPPSSQRADLGDEAQQSPPTAYRGLALAKGIHAVLSDTPEIELDGSYRLLVANATLNVVDRRGDHEELVTGWSWNETGGQGFSWERQLLLARVSGTGTLATSWDGIARLALDTETAPAGLTAESATLTLADGELQGHSAGDGQATIQGLALTLLGWSQSEGEGAATIQVQQGLPSPAQPPEADDEVPTSVLIGAGSALLAGLAVAAYYWPRLSWTVTALVLPMYSRIEKSELLDNEVREQLYETVKDEPGIHAHALSEAVDIGWGTTVYHLRRLERNGMVKSEKRGRYRRFFPSAGYVARTREVLSVLQNETTSAIARQILKDPGCNQKSICEALDISPSLANWHLNRLIDAELVDRERRGRTVHYSPGAAWDEVGEVVDDVVS